MSTIEPIHFTSADDGEETARADLYGVLAGLFAAPPSTELLQAIATAPPATGNTVLEQSWRMLTAAAAAALANGGAEAVREEYEALFIGIGKPEVLLYGSYYLAGFLMERPLAALRTDLAQLGLERADNVVESEDHIASLCEVMRFLIAGDTETDADAAGDAPPVSAKSRLTAQKRFFSVHMQSWTGEMCAAVIAHRQSRFYRRVAELARQFFEIEAQAFDIG